MARLKDQSHFQSKRRCKHVHLFATSLPVNLHISPTNHVCIEHPFFQAIFVSSLDGSKKGQEFKKHFLKRYSETSCLDLLKGPSSPRSRKYLSTTKQRISSRNPTFLLPEFDPLSSVPLGLWMGHDPVVVFYHGLGFLNFLGECNRAKDIFSTHSNTPAPPGLHTTARELQGSGALNTTKIPREDPKRDTKRAKWWREREKERKHVGSRPFGLPPSGLPPFGPHTPWGPTVRGPQFGAPPFLNVIAIFMIMIIFSKI